MPKNRKPEFLKLTIKEAKKELERAIPEVEKAIQRLDKAKKITRECLKFEFTI